MQELNHTGGKGDKERSHGWRKQYDEIDFHRGSEATGGFARRGNKLVKVYSPGRVAIFKVDLGKGFDSPATLAVVDFLFPPSLACGGVCDHPGVENCNVTTLTGWCCSQPVGHAGEHIACGIEHHRMFAWGPRPV
jgi:hypothetical protein